MVLQMNNNQIYIQKQNRNATCCEAQSNPTYRILQYGEKPTFPNEKSFHRTFSLRNIIKFKRESLFHILDTEILRRKCTNLHATEFYR